MIPKKTAMIIPGLILLTILVVHLQFGQMENLRVRALKGEIGVLDYVHREMYSGLFSGAVLTYGTSTISYRLSGVDGLTISCTTPIIASTYLKIVESWRKLSMQVLAIEFPLWYLLGSCIGFILLAIEYTLRGVDDTAHARRRR